MNNRQIAPLLPDLHLLTVLAATRSYTQAARRLGISKASASMRISELERAAGVLLVRRSSRSVALTEAGLQLVDEIQASFARIEQGFSSVRDLAGQPRGLVRVSAPVAVGRQLIAPLVAPFLAAYPEIRLELDLSDRFVNLAQEGFDLAIRHTQAAPDTHVAWVLRETRSLLVASRAYLAQAGVPTHPADLATHRCLLYLRDAGAQHWGFMREPRRGKVERLSVPVSGPFRANNSELLRAAALGGLGIALLPDFSALEALQAGELVPVLPQWQPVGFFGDRLYAIRPFAAQVPRAVQCFVDHLRQSLGGGSGG